MKGLQKNIITPSGATAAFHKIINWGPGKTVINAGTVESPVYQDAETIRINVGHWHNESAFDAGKPKMHDTWYDTYTADWDAMKPEGVDPMTWAYGKLKGAGEDFEGANDVE